MKRLSVSATWIVRKAGGLYIGANLHFPVRVLYDDGELRDTMTLTIGLLVTTIRIEIRGRNLESP